jgi:1,4-dihydroxy-2-naphthoyl-CoA hydrolase
MKTDFESAKTDPAMTQALHDGMPFTERLVICAVKADTQTVVTTAERRAEHCGSGGVLHGGYLMALADSSGATLAFLNLAQGTSTMVHKGRTTMAVQTDITNQRGALVSRTLQTQLIRLVTS